MSIHVLKRELLVPFRRDDVFEFFADARNLERITPPWLGFQITTDGPIGMHEGALIDYKLRIRGLPARWRTRITVWNPPFQFVDTQLKGPYKLWHHTHTFEEHAAGTRMTDEVQYELPLGILGDMVHAVLVRRDIETIFDYRNLKIPSLLNSPKVEIP
jgi:ligand-binding SRPBCC domain-containing protein